MDTRRVELSHAGILPRMDEARSDPARAWRTLLSAWVPVVAWAALIFAFSAQPNLTFVPDAGLDFVVRKVGHMVVFGVLALVAWRAIARDDALAASVGMGDRADVLCTPISDELHQGFVAGRQASVVDLAIDSTRGGDRGRRRPVRVAAVPGPQ